jgi:hypothetical protein
MPSHIPVTVFVLVLSSVAVANAAGDLPLTCCPQSCLPVSDADVSKVRADRTPLELTSSRFGRLPIPADVTRDVSPDGALQACISYDAFGDPHVKCILLPAAMM